MGRGCQQNIAHVCPLDGRVLVVVNPAAQNGAGERAAAWLRAQAVREGIADRTRVVTTERAGHAAEIARASAGFDVLIACGGDGTFHEVLQGLMTLPREDRSAFGVLPCGNGNDFARTVGAPLTGVEDAWRALRTVRVEPFDVGVCNGEHFLETLSFGVDAAIALGTQGRRERTGHQGTRLFLEEGVHQLAHHRDALACTIEVLDEAGEVVRAIDESVHLIAVQLGPTYGGGFAVCPDASPRDGVFDVCACHAPLGFVHAAALFLLAKGGHHQGFEREFAFLRAPGLRIVFQEEPPAQIDGEPIHGTVFAIATIPHALDVLTCR